MFFQIYLSPKHTYITKQAFRGFLINNVVSCVSHKVRFHGKSKIGIIDRKKMKKQKNRIYEKTGFVWFVQTNKSCKPVFLMIPISEVIGVFEGNLRLET